MDIAYSPGPNYIFLLAFLVLVIVIIIWFFKTKGRLKRLQVVLSVLAVAYAHLASQRSYELDKQKKELLYEFQDKNAEAVELIIEHLSNDTSLTAYYTFIGIIILMVTLIEIHIRKKE